LVLLVHGMGNHSRGQIKKDFEAALGERITAFGLDPGAILKTVDYKEFNYSEKFDLIRKQFAENAEARKKGFKYLSGKGFEAKLIQQLTAFEANFGQDDFFYTHWLDVILYSTMYFGEALRAEFIGEFDALRKKYRHTNIHVISHSLGTALVHDALAKYYRVESTPMDDVPDVPVGRFNMASLWTFANVSRLVNILNCLDDPMKSTVGPGSDGCASNVVHVRNRYDPFTWFKTYDRSAPALRDIVIDTVRNPNTHDFREYITEPDVARLLLKIIFFQNVTPAEFKKGVDDYHATVLTTQVKELRDLVTEAANDPNITTAEKAVTKFRKIQALVKKLEGQI
jgi:hypothetical protein